MPDSQQLAVCAALPALADEAAALAQRLQLPLLPPGSDPRQCEVAQALLLVSPAQLHLQLTGTGAPGPVGVDFGAAGMRHRRAAGHNEMLGRAVGIGKKPQLRVLDATAGLGRDAFVLADLGAEVTLCERHRVVCELLRAGIAAAGDSGDAWLREVAGRMQLHCGDAAGLPDGACDGIDVIYLDPMFPERQKRAAVKKEMALFQFLLGDTQDTGEQLLDWALRQPVARIVVKRPLKAALLGGVTPSHSLKGRAVRFDVHVRSAFS